MPGGPHSRLRLHRNRNRPVGLLRHAPLPNPHRLLRPPSCPGSRSPPSRATAAGTAGPPPPRGRPPPPRLPTAPPPTPPPPPPPPPENPPSPRNDRAASNTATQARP